jgi:hypothetical protein
MKPVIIINTFKTVVFNETKKPIVICDIDHTFLRPLRNYVDCFQEIKRFFSDPYKIHENVINVLEISISMGMVKQTDEEGFLYMLQKVQDLGGKLLFLTARSSSAHEKTMNDLTKVGLKNPESFEIHYTNNQTTKGEYIKNYNLLNGYDHHIFIDDYPHFLESALKIYPDMDCYLFKYNR